MPVGLPLPMELAADFLILLWLCGLGWLVFSTAPRTWARAILWTVGPWLVIWGWSHWKSRPRHDPPGRPPGQIFPLAGAAQGDWAEYQWRTRTGRSKVRVEIEMANEREVTVGLSGPSEIAHRTVVPRTAKAGSLAFVKCLLGSATFCPPAEPQLSAPGVKLLVGNHDTVPAPGLEKAPVYEYFVEHGQDSLRMHLCAQVKGIGLVDLFSLHSGTRAEESYDDLRLVRFGP